MFNHFIWNCKGSLGSVAWKLVVLRLGTVAVDMAGIAQDQPDTQLISVFQLKRSPFSLLFAVAATPTMFLWSESILTKMVSLKYSK